VFFVVISLFLQLILYIQCRVRCPGESFLQGGSGFDELHSLSLYYLIIKKKKERRGDIDDVSLMIIVLFFHSLVLVKAI